MLLGVETDNEGGDVDHLLPHTDVSLPDEDTGVVDGLGESELEHLQKQNNEINLINSTDCVHVSFIGVSLLT